MSRPARFAAFATTRCLPRETGLTLPAHGQHEHHIHRGHMTVQGRVAVRTAADHQLALVVTSRAADQRIGFQYAKRVDDLAQAGRDVNRLVLFEVVEDPVEVLPDPGRQLDARQRYFASLRAAGRRTGLPAMRASRWSRISLQGMVRSEEPTPEIQS